MGAGTGAAVQGSCDPCSGGDGPDNRPGSVQWRCWSSAFSVPGQGPEPGPAAATAWGAKPVQAAAKAWVGKVAAGPAGSQRLAAGPSHRLQGVVDSFLDQLSGFLSA